MNNYKVSTSYIRFKGRDYTDTWLSKDGIKISNIEDGEDEMAVFGDIIELLVQVLKKNLLQKQNLD